MDKSSPDLNDGLRNYVVLGSWWLKFGRAQEHLNRIKTNLSAWINSRQGEPLWTPRKEFDPKLNCFTFYVETVEIFPLEWSLDIGEVLYSYRCALDLGPGNLGDQVIVRAGLRGQTVGSRLALTCN
jgi:hypothetical protein